MAQVCVVTGGGSGMGLSAAGYMSRDKEWLQFFL